MKKFVALSFFSIYLLFIDIHTVSDVCDLSLVDFYRYISAIRLPTVFLVITFVSKILICIALKLIDNRSSIFSCIYNQSTSFTL